MKKTLLYHIFAVGLMLIATVGASAQEGTGGAEGSGGSETSTSSGVNKYKLTGTKISTVAGTNQVVYLLNLGKYQNATSKNSPYFIGRGQTWGTEIIISNIPLPFTIEKNPVGSNDYYRLKTNIIENGKTTSGYMGFIMDGNDAHAYFDDRGPSDTINTIFTPVTDVKGTVAEGSHVYRMSHFLGTAPADHHSGEYFVAALHNAHGSDNPNRTDHVNGFLANQLDSAKKARTGEFVDNNDDLWMIITEQQLKNYFSKVDAAQNDPAIATFLIKDPDFARADSDIKNWKIGDGTTTLEKYFESNTNTNALRIAKDIVRNSEIKPTETKYFDANTNYYVGNGWQTDVSGNTVGQRNNGGQWTANILGQGKVYQEVSLDGLKGGWYAVRVSATTFRNDSSGQDKYVKLFAQTSESNKVENKIAADTADPETFVGADNIVNDGHHEASVLIYIKGDDTNNEIPTDTKLTVGIDATDDHIYYFEDPAKRTWTCFDNFQLWYLGNPKNFVLLDEDETSIDYINKQNTFVNANNLTEGSSGSRTKSTVYMKRQMNANTWNTLVLPFSIEEDVVLQTFGAGTVYAILEGATDKDNPTTIYFNRELDGIQKGKLYLIRPTNSQPTGLAAVSSSTLNDDSEEALISWGTEGTNDQSYWTFEAVDFGNDKVDNKDVDYKADVYTGNQGPEIVKDGTVYFAGTYISHGDELYIPEKSYVLQGSTTNGNTTVGAWYYRTKGTKTKGFRGWLQTKEPGVASSTPTANPAKFYVDGELWETRGIDGSTGIDNLTINGMKVVIRDNNVYNLQGQRVRRGTSLEGLAKGIYVVNGKKVSVK